MKEYTVTSTIANNPPMTFTGEMLAEVDSQRPSSDKYLIMRLYQTNKGKIVLESIGVGMEPDDFRSFKVFQNVDAMMRRTETTRMRTRLLAKAGLID